MNRIEQHILKTHLSLPSIDEAGITTDVLRLDRVHPLVSGNKWFKLKEYLADAAGQKLKTIVTFGGAYSNHIIATAAACAAMGFQAVGIIRGEASTTLSPTLLQAKELGMDLHFLSREAYKLKQVPETIHQHYKEVYFISEGGYGIKGMEGASTILTEEDQTYTHIVAAVGTGTTLAGLIAAAGNHQHCIGISALKNHYKLKDEINALLPSDRQDRFTLLHDYHFGGYANYTNALIEFMNDWYRITGVPSDFVYTGKLFYAFSQLCRERYFSTASKILLIHSGGLQGNRSLKRGTLIF